VIAPPPARRSCLSVPAASPRKLEMAPSFGADEIVLDLEDSVVPAMKPDALSAALRVLRGWPATPDLPGTTAVSVRVNPPRTRWCHLELAALAASGETAGSVVLPKVESAADLAFAERLLDGAEAAAGRRIPLRIQALIETAPGLSHVGEIAGSSERLESLIIGYADLGTSLGRSSTGGRSLDLWLAAQESVLAAARTHGLQAIDGPFLGTVDNEQFRLASARARDLGFDGKWAIHPSQVPALNALFSPSDEDISRAHAVLAALDRGKSDARTGAVELDGEMVDEATRRSALRLLAQAATAERR